MTKTSVVGTADELCAEASQRAGYGDFGADDDNFREALGVLLDSYEREAGFTPLGATMTRHYLLGGLVARLLSEAAWRRYPSHANVTIERPIFVTGLPRTGTTALHRLLGADPAHQGLELWLAEYPQPRPPREEWDSFPEYRQLQAYYAKAHREDPEFQGLHYVAEDVLEECWQLLRQSVHSVSYESLAHVPTYAQWLSNQDWAPPYRRHRRNLQLIGLNDVSKRWVLKNPSHLFSIDAIFETYPDALIVQCHRPPETLLASMCSLAEHSTKGWSSIFSREQIGHDTLDIWARAIERFTSSRAKHNPNQFCDVDYFDFVAAPVDTVRSIYEHFGLPLTEEAVLAIGSAHEESQLDHRAPKHQYSLDDYGLTPDAVKARFEHW
jgi:hypothetical protein